MSTESIVLTSLIPAPPLRVYEAWMSSKEHAAFTGSRARIDAREGSSFSAGDGYITGSTRELEKGKRIVQSWRTTDFPAEAPDSLLTLTFKLDKASGGTEVTLLHDEIPEGQSEAYAQGWVDYYFEPLKRYFAKRSKAASAKPMAKKPAAKKAAAAKKPVARKAAAATKPAAVKKPAAKQPAARKTVAAGKPAAKKPAARKAAAAKKPAATKSAAVKKPAARRKSSR